MGISSDAYFFFGVEICDENAGTGLECPLEEGDVHGWISDHVTEALSAAGIEGVGLDAHCCCEAPVFYLHTVREFASRGYAEGVDLTTIAANEAKDREKLLAALEAIGLADIDDKCGEGIGWWLASYMG